MRSYRLFLLAPAAILLALLLTVQMMGALNNAQAATGNMARSLAASASNVADFEGGVPGTWFQYGDGSAVVNAAVTTVADTDSLALPGQVGANDILSVTANVPTWAGFGAALAPIQDWSDYDALSFWFYGENSGTTHEFELQTAQNDDRRVSFVDNFSGWRQLIFPFHTFGVGGAYDLSQVDNWVFVLDGTIGSLKLDNIQLVNLQPFADFEGNVPAGWFQYGDGGTAVNPSVVTVAVTDSLAIPGQVGANDILSVTANVPTWAGFGAALSPVADWSDMQGVSFWFYGENSGTTHEFELQTAQNDDRRVSFVDDFSGWRLLTFPFATFGTTPYDLSQVDNWVFVLDGTVGSFYLDHLSVFGDAGNVTQRAQFAPNSYAVTEGSAVTLTVSLNVTSAVPVSVDYATVDDSAVSGSDFTAISGTLTIPAGESGGEIVLATTDDAEVEGPERLFVVLSNPVSVTLAAQVTATVTLRDNDEASAPAGGHGVIVDNYEYTTTLPTGKDANGNDIGFVTWSASGASSSVTLTVPPTQVPGAAAGNQVIQLDLNLGAGQWGGFTHAFENEAVNTWISKDWSSYVGVSFWLYGNNTGGALYLDIQDNRTPGSTKDDAERWSVDIPDDFSGWKFFQIPFSQFNRKDIGNGAPFDGFGKTEIWGYAFGGFNTIANQTYYVDDFALTPRTTVVDDYELSALPTGKDGNGNDIGFVTWSASGASSSITLTVPPMQVPGAAAGNQAIQLDLNLGAGQWGGFTHAFENAAVDTWVSQDWSTYEGICFWLYGNNTGGALYLDIQDNRTPGSTKDDAERWSVDIADDFSGWKFFQIPFSQFNRKDIGNGAPFDGFGKDEVWGYAFGGFNTIENQSYYVDDFTLYGNVGGGEESVKLAFASAEYTVTEGLSALMTVSLNMTSTQPVTVTYASLEGQATPDRDYTPVSGTLVFAPGVAALTITIPTLDDDQHEREEKVMVNLYNVDGADFGFQRRAMLTIVDNDAAAPAAQDDFEGSHPFMATSGVALSITELAENDVNALPGQEGYEQVLTVQYNDAATTPNRVYRTFTEPQDWSAADGLTFWVFGNNSGKAVTVDLWDNQLTATEALSSTQWTLRWSDEFSGTAGTPPNPNHWKHEIGDGALNGIPGWGNSEFQYYTDDPANASLDGNGNLRLRLSAVNTATTDLVCYYGPCRYTSARLLTQDRADFLYGKIEARIKLPPTDQSGVWPAFWSLGSDIREVGWPQTGEIDIMEYVSRVPNEIFGTIHGPGYSGGASYGDTINIPNLTAGFHTYSVEWWENHIIWYVDGVKYHEARNTDAFLNGKEWVFNHPFFLLLNVAIGGNFGGAISDQLTLPQDTLVDYVRVYGAPLSAERFEATFVDDFSGWRKITVPFRTFVRSAEQADGAPNDGLTLSSVNGYGFRFPSGAGSVAAQATVTTHIDQVELVTFASEFYMPIISR
jgi:beta-glucanase (GH16 family)